MCIFIEGALYCAIPPSVKKTPPPKVRQIILNLNATRAVNLRLPEHKRIKTVIFNRWTSDFALLQYYLAEAGFGSVILKGKQETGSRQNVIREFQHPRAQKIKLGVDVDATLARRLDPTEYHRLKHAYVLTMSEAGLEGLNLTRLSDHRNGRILDASRTEPTQRTICASWSNAFQ